MVKIIDTDTHQATKVPGGLHAQQIMRLGQIIQSMIDENGGWGHLHLELRGGAIHMVSKETSELFSPEHLRSTA